MKRRASYVPTKYRSKRRGTLNFTGKTPLKIGQVQVPGQYAALVVDPWNHPSVSIPDLSSVPCAVFSAEQQFTFETSTAGTGGFVAYIGVGDPNGAQYEVQNPSTTNDVTYVYVGGAGAKYEWLNGLKASYGWCRVVAASVIVEYLGNDTNNQGKIAGFVGLGVNGGVSEGLRSGLTHLENARDCFVGPAKDGICLTWRPKQTQDFDQYATSASTGSNNNSWLGYFQVATSGCASGAKFQVRIKFHFEGIPVGGSATEGILDPPLDAFVSPEDFGASSSLLASAPQATSATRANAGYFSRISERISQAIRNYVGDPSSLMAAAIMGSATLASQAMLSGGAGGMVKYGGPPGGF